MSEQAPADLFLIRLREARRFGYRQFQHLHHDEPLPRRPGARTPNTAVRLSWTLANFARVDTPTLQAFQMSTGIFARSRARPGPTKNPTYPHILGHSARPPLRKLAKVELSRRGRGMTDRVRRLS